MYSFQKHYQRTLAQFYSQVYGGRSLNYSRAKSILQEFGISSNYRDGMQAADLGAGTGFFSVPLSEIGYSVLALDLDPSLNAEHLESIEGHSVTVIEADLMALPDYSNAPLDLVLCMTDTIAHLNNEEQILTLFKMVHRKLCSGGQFLISFRDQSIALEGENRFIPFYSGENLIATTFVEFSDRFVDVTDIIYSKEPDWKMFTSSYRKVRLVAEGVSSLLENSGFSIKITKTISGMHFILAEKLEQG
ncbi:MAG: class I SAM-dependent methyltransferase [Leptospiraceae bacterium]